jgi:hypothetical protein
MRGSRAATTTLLRVQLAPAGLLSMPGLLPYPPDCLSQCCTHEATCLPPPPWAVALSPQPTAELLVSRLVGSRAWEHDRAGHARVGRRARRHWPQRGAQLRGDRLGAGAQRVDAQGGAERGACESVGYRGEARRAERAAEVRADLWGPGAGRGERGANVGMGHGGRGAAGRAARAAAPRRREVRAERRWLGGKAARMRSHLRVPRHAVLEVFHAGCDRYRRLD